MTSDREYDVTTTETQVNGTCPDCNETELTYTRIVTRKYQLHITCQACGTTIKSKSDPTGLIKTTGHEFETITRKRTIQELDLNGLFALEEGGVGDSSLIIEP